MNDIRFSKDSTAAGETGDGVGLFYQFGIIFDPQAQPGHLVFKKGTSAPGTVFIHCKSGRSATIQSGEETGALTSNFNDRFRFRRQQMDAAMDGGNIAQS